MNEATFPGSQVGARSRSARSVTTLSHDETLIVVYSAPVQADNRCGKMPMVARTRRTLRAVTLVVTGNPDTTTLRAFLQCGANPVARSKHPDLISAVAGAGTLLCSVDRCEASASSMTTR